MRIIDGAIDGRLERDGGGSKRATISVLMREKSVTKEIADTLYWTQIVQLT